LTVEINYHMLKFICLPFNKIKVPDVTENEKQPMFGTYGLLEVLPLFFITI